MTNFKDRYFDELVRLTNEYEDAGLSPDKAYEKAGEAAYDSARDREADHTDNLRKRAKEELAR